MKKGGSRKVDQEVNNVWEKEKGGKKMDTTTEESKKEKLNSKENKQEKNERKQTEIKEKCGRPVRRRWRDE